MLRVKLLLLFYAFRCLILWLEEFIEVLQEISLLSGVFFRFNTEV